MLHTSALGPAYGSCSSTSGGEYTIEPQNVSIIISSVKLLQSPKSVTCFAPGDKLLEDQPPRRRVCCVWRPLLDGGCSPRHWFCSRTGCKHHSNATAAPSACCTPKTGRREAGAYLDRFGSRFGIDAKHNIFRFQVTVRHAIGVAVGHRSHKLREDIPGTLLRRAAIFLCRMTRTRKVRCACQPCHPCRDGLACRSVA